MDPLLEFKCALTDLPDFYAELFHRQERDCIGQVDLSQVAVAIGAVDCNFTSGCVVKRVGKRGLLGLTIQDAEAKAALGQVEVFMANQADRVCSIEIP